MLKRQGDQYYGYCNYPYVIDNIIELTNSPYGTDWYYYFYNWDVTPLPCESPMTSHEVVVVTCASIDEVVINVDIYPNPTRDLLNIDLGQNPESTVVLYNVLGEEVLRETAKNNTTISLKELPKGLYSVRVWNNNGAYKEQIVLQ